MNRRLFPPSPVRLTRQNANDIGVPTNEQMGNTSEMDDFVNQMRNDDSQLGNLDDENNMNNNMNNMNMNNNINNNNMNNNNMNNNEYLTNEQMDNIRGGRSMRKRRRTKHKRRYSHKRRKCSHKRRRCSHKH